MIATTYPNSKQLRLLNRIRRVDTAELTRIQADALLMVDRIDAGNAVLGDEGDDRGNLLELHRSLDAEHHCESAGLDELLIVDEIRQLVAR